MSGLQFVPAAYDERADVKSQVRELYRQNMLLTQQLTHALSTLDDSNMTAELRKRLKTLHTASESVAGVLTALNGLATKQALELLADTVDGKVTTFYANMAPARASQGDLWFDTSNRNRLSRWNGIQWEPVDDARIVEALDAAGVAQATADGKIVAHAQATAPEGQAAGDLWINIAKDNALYWWNGVDWVEVRDTYTETYVRKTDAGVEVGEVGAVYKCVLTPTGLVFYQNGDFLGEFANNRLYTHRAAIRDKLVFGQDGTGYFDLEASSGRLTLKFRG